MTTRRSFLAAVAAAFVVDPERLLWVPGKKLISIPSVQRIPLRVMAAFDIMQDKRVVRVDTSTTLVSGFDGFMSVVKIKGAPITAVPSCQHTIEWDTDLIIHPKYTDATHFDLNKSMEIDKRLFRQAIERCVDKIAAELGVGRRSLILPPLPA